MTTAAPHLTVVSGPPDPNLTHWTISTTDGRTLTGLGTPETQDLPTALRVPGTRTLHLTGLSPAGPTWPVQLQAIDGTLTIGPPTPASTSTAHIDAPIPAAELISWLTNPQILLGDVLPGGPPMDDTLFIASFFEGPIGATKTPQTRDLGHQMIALVNHT